MSFTRDYKVQPNAAQLSSIERCCMVTANYYVNVKKTDVICRVEEFTESLLIVQLLSNGVVIMERLIGPKGGIK